MGHGKDRGGARGRLRIATVTLLIAGAVLVAPATWDSSPVEAAVTSANPADGFGDWYPDFTTDDALFAYVTTDTRGGRVCVLDEADEDGGSCDSPAFGSANIIVGVGTLFTLLEGPDLPLGNYVLRTESPTPDGWSRGYTSAVFHVGPCVEDCALHIGRQQADEFKQASADATRMASATCDFFALKGAFEDARSAGKKARGARGSSGGGGVSVNSVLGAIDFDIPSYNDQAMKILQMMSCEVAKMHEDIANDPPDPELYVVSEPGFSDLPDITGDDEGERLVQTLDRQAAFGIATRQAYERYQGAVEADDLVAQRLQAATIGRHGTAFTEELRAAADAARAYAASLADEPGGDAPVIGSTAELDAIRALNERVTTDGFTAAEIADLTGLGLTADEIANVRTWFAVDPTLLQVGTTLPDALEQLASSFEAAVEPADRFARNALAISTADLAQPTGTAWTEFVNGPPNTTIRATADAESPDGDPLSYTWDFGDGTTGTGRVVEHTYAVDGTFTPTVTIKETPVWGSSITVAAVAVPIALHGVPTAAVDRIGVVSGASVTFNPLANDDDPDTPLAQRVLVTHGTPSGGTLNCAPNGACTYSASPTLIGSETIGYTMTDGTNSSTSTIIVTIVAPNAPTAANSTVFARSAALTSHQVSAVDPDVGPSDLTIEIVTPPTAVHVTVGSGLTFQVYDPDGTATTDSFTYRVFDGAQYSSVATVDITLGFDDLKPVAADVAVSMPAGVPVPFVLSATDPEGNPVSFLLGPTPTGSSLSGSGASHVFDPGTLSPGTYAMTYTANDGWNNSEPATISITIQPPPGGPIVHLGPDVELDEGYVTIMAIARDPEGGTLDLRWEVRDDAADLVATSSDANLSQRLSAGQYDVTLTVTDALGRTSSDTVGLRLRNIVPTVSELVIESHAANRGVSDVGEPIRIHARWTDPGDDVAEFRWSIDSAPPIVTATAQLDHTFTTAGSHTVQVTAVDGAGAVGSASRTIEVAPIVADSGPDRIVPEGSEVRFETDPDVPPAAVRWDFGDGTTSTELAPRHRWTGDSTRTVTLTLDYTGYDGTTYRASDTATITFTNVAPSVAPDIPVLVEAGTATHLLAGAVDPGDDPLTITWDLGDGPTAGGPLLTHTWNTPGDYPVVVTATDGESPVASAAVAVRVVAAGELPATIDSRGTDFHFAFERNNLKAQSEQYLLISGEQDTTGTVAIPGIGFRAEFAVAGGRVTTVRLPDDTIADDPVDGTLPAVEIDHRTVAVHARREVTVYGVNRQQYTTDAFLAVPDDLAGTQTRMATYGSSDTQLTVVALEPDTQVLVGTPRHGNPDYEGIAQPETVLQPGEVLHLSGTLLGVEHGSPVIADKPVQVLSGNRCTDVVAPFCDHLVEALWPTAMWGSEFLTVPLATRTAGDVVRVTADRAGTEIRVDGDVVATLDAGSFHELDLSVAAHIESSAPVLVAQYSKGSAADAVDSDPFMMLVPPQEQWLDTYAVATLPGIPHNFLNLTVRADGASTVRVDGDPVAAGSWVAIGDTDYVGTQAEVGEGEHRITAERPVGVAVYGFGSYDSYGYPGGLAMAPVAALADLTLDPADATHAVGDESCVVATAFGTDDTELPGVRVDLGVGGANPTSVYGRTEADGTVTFCQIGRTVGLDTLSARAGSATASASRQWTARPVVTTTTTTLPPPPPSTTTTTTTTTTLPPPPSTTLPPPTTTTPTLTTTTTPTTTTTTVRPTVSQPRARALPDGAARYVPLEPARLFDTRANSFPGPKGRVGPDGSIDVQVAGRVGVPANAVAVVLNVTVTDTDSPGYVTVYPTGVARPDASSINNIHTGQTRPNLVTVPLGTEGRITLYALGRVHLLADVAGYYLAVDDAVAAGRFVPLTPQRLFDTRPATPAAGPKVKLAAGGSIDVQVLGVGDVPASGVSAVVINLTGTESSAAGFLTAYPAGLPLPDTSSVNFSEAGTTAPNLAIVPIGANGRITIYSSHGAHVLGDVTGYITDATAPIAVAGLFVPVSPERVFDTRPNTSPPGPKGFVPAGGTIDARVAGVGSIPATAAGVALNVTAIDSPPGYLTAWERGAPQPNASTLNFTSLPVDTRANGAMLPIGTGGEISFFSLNGSQILADVSGYFLGPESTR